jgi:hypothetical protein
VLRKGFGVRTQWEVSKEICRGFGLEVDEVGF